MAIIIENKQDKIKLSDNIKRLLSKAVELSLELEKFKIPSEVGFLIVDDEKIREINCERRKINMPTDVLSFPIVDMYEGSIISNTGDFDLDNDLLLLGDIVISAETAGKQAAKFGHTLERELAFLAAHGIFHLLGYDHESREEEKRMMKKQEAVLAQMGLIRYEK